MLLQIEHLRLSLGGIKILSDVNFELLQENYRRLCEMRDQDGQPLRVVKLPMPGAVVSIVVAAAVLGGIIAALH